MAKIYTPATKSLNPWNVDDNRGWDILGGTSDTPEIELVPTVADCVEELGKALADLPFSVYDEAGNVVDDSDDYKNITGAIPNPYSFLWLTATSLVTFGACYWGKKKNPAKYTKGLQFWVSPSIQPQIKPDTNAENLKFRRTNVTEEIPAEKILYIWLPDPRVEFGPPGNYPMKRAEKSAGAVSAINTFVNNYMNSGMVRAFIAQSDIPASNDDEKREMEDYLTRILTGVRRAISKIRVIRKSIEIKPVGGGLDELRNVGVIKEIKSDILEAFGVPASRVWGNAANYATAANDTIVFITSEVMPLARCVQEALNEQVFKPYGYKLVFEPRRLEEFAVILAERVKVLQPIMDTLSKVMKPAAALKAAADMTGLELSPDVMEQIEAMILEEQRAPEPPALPAPQEPTAPDMTPEQTKALVELDKWQAKSAKAGTLVTWHAVNLPADIVQAVKGGMGWDEAREMLGIKAPPEGHPFYGNQFVSFSGGTAQAAPSTVLDFGEDEARQAIERGEVSKRDFERAVRETTGRVEIYKSDLQRYKEVYKVAKEKDDDFFSARPDAWRPERWKSEIQDIERKLYESESKLRTLSKFEKYFGDAPEQNELKTLAASINALAEAMKAEQSFTPPASVREAARRGLELRKKHGRGGLDTQEAGEQGIGSGVARASNLANGDKIPMETIRRMSAFFSRHEKNKAGGEDDAGYIAWQLWGGDAGQAWVNSILKDFDER